MTEKVYAYGRDKKVGFWGEKLNERFRKKWHGLRSVFNDQSIDLDIV